MKTICSLFFLMISLSTFGKKNLITMTMEEPDLFDISFKGSGNVTIHWGDGTSNIYTIDNDYSKAYTHTYSKSSEKIITITGDNITGLRCNYMQLTSLDVSRNANLTLLECFANNLTSLDLSKNTKLTDLCCNVNRLTSLDVSNSTFGSYINN